MCANHHEATPCYFTLAILFEDQLPLALLILILPTATIFTTFALVLRHIGDKKEAEAVPVGRCLLVVMMMMVE